MKRILILQSSNFKNTSSTYGTLKSRFVIDIRDLYRQRWLGLCSIVAKAHSHAEMCTRGAYVSRSRLNDRLSISSMSSRGWMGQAFGQFVCRRGWLARHCNARVRSCRSTRVGSILYERRSVSRVFLFAFVRYTEKRGEKLAPIRFVWHCAAPRKVRGHLLANDTRYPLLPSWKSSNETKLFELEQQTESTIGPEN